MRKDEIDRGVLLVYKSRNREWFNYRQKTFDLERMPLEARGEYAQLLRLLADDCAPSALPISTAPTDRTRVLVWRPDEGDGEHIAHWGVDYFWNGVWQKSRRGQQPTHWMPLPGAPFDAEETCKKSLRVERETR